MTSPNSKANLMPWQWALIGSGSTIILGLAVFGLWNLITLKNSAISSASPDSILSAASPNTNFLTQFQVQQNKARQFEGREYVGSMNRAQEAFYIENNQFTPDFNKLGLGLKQETENYTYSIVAIDYKRIVQHIALAKIEGLKSYIGITYATNIGSTNEMTTMAKICESIQPTREMPPKPLLSGNEFSCPTGFADLSRQ